MEKNLKIKVCGLNDYVNIQEVVQLQPDFLGFIFYSLSKRNFTLKALPPIPEEVKKVGVFVNPSFDEVIRKVKFYNLDFVQLHGQESPDFCEQLKYKGIEIIKAFGINEKFDFHILKSYEPYCIYFLLDAEKGGSGKSFDWKLLKKYKNQTSFLLAGGISLENLNEVLNLNHPQMIGLDWNSQWEILPGIKDISLLKQGFQNIRKYDKTQ